MIKETDLHIINFNEGTVWSKKFKKYIGSNINRRYYRIRIENKEQLLHRFLYEQYHDIKLTQEQLVNHINHNTFDNRIQNLNMVDNSRNLQYRKKQINNTSGYSNIRWIDSEKGTGWSTSIQVNNIEKKLKIFKKKEEAIDFMKKIKRYLNSYGFYYYIEDEEVILQEDRRKDFDFEEFDKYVREITKKCRKMGSGRCFFYRKKWKSHLTYKGQYIHIGRFDTEEQAQKKLNLVLDYKIKNPNISVEDLRNYVLSI